MGFLTELKKIVNGHISKIHMPVLPEIGVSTFNAAISPFSILEHVELEESKRKEWKEYFKNIPFIQVKVGYKITQSDEGFRRHIENNWVEKIDFGGIEKTALPQEFIDEVGLIAVSIAFDRLYEEFRIMGRWL